MTRGKTKSRTDFPNPPHVTREPDGTVYVSVEAMAIDPGDLLLLEARRWQVSEICRVFGAAPAHKENAR